MPTIEPIAFVSLKSFGDFIIARWALRNLAQHGPSVHLAMGEHLNELSEVLGAWPTTHRIEHGEAGVPAVFDWRKLGLRRSVRSAWWLRRTLRDLPLPRGTTLLFDRIGPRERFIAGGLPMRALPSAANIYLAYEALLGIGRPLPLAAPAVRRSGGTRLGIFPGSRLDWKTIPGDVLSDLALHCQELGATVEIFALEGEPHGGGSGTLQITPVPRRFAAMAQAVASVDAVISADSMPAHMAEYFARPVFVMSREPNRYWLPLSSLNADRWSLFGERQRTAAAVSRFLDHD